MGKVHRIKKQFWKIVTQDPLSVGHYWLANTRAKLYIGKRWDGSFFLMDYSPDHAYKGLVEQLIKEYHSRGSSSDKTPIVRE